MRNSLLALLVCIFASGFLSTTALSGEVYSVTGVVDSINRKADKIKVGGKRYRLHRELVVEDKHYLREVEPVIKAGDNVELLFVGSSSKSSVQEIWLLRGAKK